MLIYLIAIVVALFLLSYYTLGQDFFQPSCIVNASYVVSTLCTYINKDIWKVTIHSSTVGIICLGLVVFYLINLVVHLNKNHIILNSKRKDMSLIHVNSIIFFIVIIVQILALIIYYKEIIRITGGGMNFSLMMNEYRMSASYGTGESVSGLSGQLAKVSFVCAQVFIYIFTNNSILGEIKGNRHYLLPASIYVVQAILTGGRFNILVLVFFALIIYNILWHRKNSWKKTLEFKVMMRIILIVCVLFVAFYWGKALVGRQNDSDMITYIASYAGGSIPLLDMFLQNPPTPSDLFGKETFYSLLKDLKQLGLLKFENYIIHLEFRSANGTMLGNVYTAFRRQLQDFGFGGMLILQMIWSGIFSIWYKNIRYNPRNISIIFYATMAYTLFLHSINDYFYMSVVSIGYVITLIMMYIIYQSIILVRIRLRARSFKHSLE